MGGAPRRLGARLRNKIFAATEQLERFASATAPKILVIYDARREPIRGIYPEEIKAAMYGNERVALHVPTNPNQPVTFGERTFAHNGRLKPTTRTHISAIAVMKEKSRAGALHVDVYHNEHPATPLASDSLSNCTSTTQYQLAQGEGARAWARVTTSVDSDDQGGT